ncbi:MAG: hypothetical protein ACT4QC_22335 [Planctomycetaceae bacterium]
MPIIDAKQPDKSFREIVRILDKHHHVIRALEHAQTLHNDLAAAFAVLVKTLSDSGALDMASFALDLRSEGIPFEQFEAARTKKGAP